MNCEKKLVRRIRRINVYYSTFENSIEAIIVDSSRRGSGPLIVRLYSNVTIQSYRRLCRVVTIRAKSVIVDSTAIGWQAVFDNKPLSQ